ncbi:MAG: glucose/arabinose dehydrogenase [Glaciecola sp.]|jgi:glucose/arabinose dehydrogenase
MSRTLITAIVFTAISSFAMATEIKVEELASGLKNPWSIAFMNNGDALVTERAGGLRLLSKNGELSSPISGLPEASVVGQGGMLGVALHPDFEKNKWVYVCLSIANGEVRGSEVYRGKLTGNKLQNVKEIFVAKPKVDTAHHFGCRLAFDNDKKLFISLGDRTKKDDAQLTSNHFGVVVRVNDDGSVPTDNPFLDGKAPEIFSYGHRNVQGMALHPTSGRVWTHEHGPKGGDEVNILENGDNYGWPTITYGVNYDGSSITDVTEMDKMRQPLTYWVPSIAPSGMTFYTGNEFPEWKGNLFVGSLKFRYLNRMVMDGEKVMEQEALLKDRNERVRDVKQAPDGSIYVLTDEVNGKVLRLTKG